MEDFLDQLTAEGDSLRRMLAKGQRPHCRHCYGTGKRPVLTAEWHKGITQTSEPCGCGADVAVSEAAERLLTLIYLYPNYRVDSRGPSGLIVDALEVLAPDLADRLREGETPEALLSALASPATASK